jgi:uncharacterized protein YndB with AHSA1/START domain
MARRTSAASRLPKRDHDASTGRELVIERIFDAPRELVFKLWTQPEHAARWWGPQGFTTISCEMEVRPGGTWRRCMRSPEGALYWKRGVYLEIAPPERLVFTYVNEDADGEPGHETLVTVSFAEHGPKTRLTLRHTRFESVEARDAHEGGWTSCMDRFADYLANA